MADVICAMRRYATHADRMLRSGLMLLSEDSFVTRYLFATHLSTGVFGWPAWQAPASFDGSAPCARPPAKTLSLLSSKLHSKTVLSDAPRLCLCMLFAPGVRWRLAVWHPAGLACLLRACNCIAKHSPLHRPVCTHMTGTYVGSIGFLRSRRV